MKNLGTCFVKKWRHALLNSWSFSWGIGRFKVKGPLANIFWHLMKKWVVANERSWWHTDLNSDQFSDGMTFVPLRHHWVPMWCIQSNKNGVKLNIIKLLSIYQGSLKFKSFNFALVFKYEPILILKIQKQNVIVSIIVNSMDLYINVMCFCFTE